jgi:hypothetical protein
MSKNTVKYAENACEYKTMELIAQDLGPLSILPQSFYESTYANYISALGLGSKELKFVMSEIATREPLCIAAAESIANSLKQNYSNRTFKIVAMNRLGLKEGVSQKSDINIEVYNENTLEDVREISLKLYIGRNKKGSMNIQVASGTYLSTLCGLGFDVVGRGVFESNTGERFSSKKSDSKKILSNFSREYGAETSTHLNRVIDLTKEAHKLRDEPVKPSNISSIRKSIGGQAISAFIDLLTLSDSSGKLRTRLLGRLGLSGSTSKEMVAACFVDTKGTVQVLNSIGNSKFHDRVALLNDPSSSLSFAKSGQGLEFSFDAPNGETIVSTKMPLTININGAWANKDRWCKLDERFYKKGERRVTKSKQLDTSTNFYIDIGKLF